jgi:hypothetical protein
MKGCKQMPTQQVLQEFAIMLACLKEGNEERMEKAKRKLSLDGYESEPAEKKDGR